MCTGLLFPIASAFLLLVCLSVFFFWFVVCACVGFLLVCMYVCLYVLVCTFVSLYIVSFVCMCVVLMLGGCSSALRVAPA